MSELKNCPFCEGEARLESQGIDAAVHCYSCGARGAVIDVGCNLDNISNAEAEKKCEAMEQEAIKAWNTRTLTLPPIPPDRDGVYSAFDEGMKAYKKMIEDSLK